MTQRMHHKIKELVVELTGKLNTEKHGVHHIDKALNYLIRADIEIGLQAQENRYHANGLAQSKAQFDQQRS